MENHFPDQTMAHTRRRSEPKPNRLAGRASGSQASRSLHRVAPGCGERVIQRGIRSPDNSVGYKQRRGC